MFDESALANVMSTQRLYQNFEVNLKKHFTSPLFLTNIDDKRSSQQTRDGGGRPKEKMGWKNWQDNLKLKTWLLSKQCSLQVSEKKTFFTFAKSICPPVCLSILLAVCLSVRCLTIDFKRMLYFQRSDKLSRNIAFE